MADNALVSMAQQFTGLPMDALIGAPLNAAADANAANSYLNCVMPRIRHEAGEHTLSSHHTTATASPSD